ncbi:MAG TPA: FtsX-like permease family protein [candidate division WOR-3 bacterium]|uniref:FtsX-like permease family protein n=1 Tax=candidate division WOR-3 bacterium TaxID=2052148 RepID=A0A7V0T6U3_UNCW3|nr:FtsX-like permease family protein [candidate division WOR-3 bacterium]
MLAFLAKGLLRDRSRSLFPLLTVAVGVSLCVLLDAYIRGARDGILRTTASFVSGHVRVTTRAAAREGVGASNELALLDAAALQDELERDHPGVDWTPRIRFGGLLDVPDSAGRTRAQTPIAGMAVDLAPDGPERRILNLEQALVSGRLPEAPDEVLVAAELARRLELGPGDRLTLVSSTMHGAMAVHNFILAGTVRFGITAMDRAAMLAPIEGIRPALDMADAADEILGFLPRFQYDDREAARLAAAFNTGRGEGDDEFAAEMNTLRTASGLGGMMDLIDYASALIVGLFVVAMSVVLWNAGLMGSLRRYGEIGIRLALGEPKGAVYRALLAESLLIGLVGSALGTLVGLGFSYYLQEVGFNIAGMMQDATMVMDDVIRARIAPPSYIVGFLPGLLATFAGAAISGLGVYRRQTASLAKEFSG